MTFLRCFLYIVGGALASSALGGLFASVVALVSPEFVSTLFTRDASGSLVRYATAVGMIWGVFLGTAVMGFPCCWSQSFTSLASSGRRLTGRTSHDWRADLLIKRYG